MPLLPRVAPVRARLFRKGLFRSVITRFACRLDLGEATYAATCHIDHANRPVLWVWLRDPRPDTAPALDTCGCLGVPRLLSYVSTPDKEVAFQEPIPELSRLRHERLWSADAGTSVSGVEELPGVEATHIDAQIVVQRCVSLGCLGRHALRPC